MNKFLKGIITAIVLLFTFYTLYGIFKAFVGNYIQNASLVTTGLILIAVAVLLYGVGYRLRKLWALAALLLFVSLEGCNYAKSNQQVVVSDDCGMKWKLISAGDAVPRGTGNPCFMKVVIPNFPMQGDSRFIANLKDRVRATVHIDYDYSITKPLAFIVQAKYLGKANTSADDSGALEPSAFEGAENMVIDKRIKDVSKSLFLGEDIIELDQADLENHLLVESNKALEPYGVQLNFITLTFDLDEQTRQAIDVSTAMKIYESKGLGDLGKQVMIQRAGATKVTVENKIPQPAQPAE
ncbi:hypothetical protein [Larkinella arboricola]